MEMAMRHIGRELTVLTAVGLLSFGIQASAAEGTGAADKGNAGGASLSDQKELVDKAADKPALELSDQQRQAILEAIVHQESHQATPKEFKATVGADIPRTLDLHPLPRPLVYEMPALKEYMYAHIDRNIVLADALKKKVIALIPLPENLAHSGGTPDKKEAAANAVGGLPRLSDEQVRMIYQRAAGEAQPVPDGPPMRAGVQVPASITLSALPPELGTQIPSVQPLHYAKLQDGRLLLVDPQQRKVIGVITQEEGARVVLDGNAAQKGDTTGIGGTGAYSRDPLRGREQTGNPSAYTGPTTTGPNTD
jgi:hypothetical protein